MKRILLWAIGVSVVVLGLVLAAMVCVDYARVGQVRREFAALKPHDQVSRLQIIASKRDRRFAEVVRTCVEDAKNRDVLQAAGYAAMRINAVDLLPVLQKRADEGPDDQTRAQLIANAARLSNRDARLDDWLAQGARSDEPWRRVGSAIGLMHTGRLEAGPMLLAIIRGGSPQTKALAMQQLVWIVRPMAQAIGRPMACLDTDPITINPQSIDQIDRFWRQYVTTSLFNNVLARLTVRDPDWAEMGRLIRARDMVAKWLQ